MEIKLKPKTIKAINDLNYKLKKVKSIEELLGLLEMFKFFLLQ